MGWGSHVDYMGMRGHLPTRIALSLSVSGTHV